APAVTSFIQATAFVALRYGSDFWPMFVGRTLTNTFAILTVVPPILHAVSWLRRADHQVNIARIAEATLLFVGLITLGVLAFLVPMLLAEHALALVCAMLAILLWSAARFGAVGACGSVWLLGVLATLGALNQTSLFASGSYTRNMVLLMLFLSV